MAQKTHWIFFLVLAVFFFACGESRKNQRKKHFLHMGNLSYKEKLYPDAIRYYHEAIAEDTTFAQAYNNLGLVYFKTGKPGDALLAFNQAIAYKIDFAEAFYNRANVRYEQRDFENALSDLNQIKHTYAKREAIHFSKGLNFFNLKKYDSADYSFSKALELNAGNIENYLNLASTKYYKKEYEVAMELVGQCLEIDNRSSEAFNILGMIYAKQNQEEKAMEAYDEGLKYKSNNAYILNNRGYLFLSKNELDKARVDINESMMIAPENPWAYRNKGIYYYKIGDYKNAQRLLLQCVEMDESMEFGYFFLGKAWLRRGDVSKACAAFGSSADLGELEGKKAYQQHCQ